MSWEAVDAVLRRSKSREGARLVLVTIAHHADRFGGNAYPSLATLHGETGLTARHVMRCVEQLEALGELGCARRAAPGQANLYTILLVDNSVDNLEQGSQVVTPMSPSNKEADGAVVTFATPDGDICDTGMVTPMSPKHYVNRTEDFKEGGEDARARDKSFAPITKAHSARKPAHPSPEQPKEGALTPLLPPQDDSAGLADGADIEALLADPVLLVAAGAWLSLQGRGLETLTAAECETLSRSRAAWGKRFSPDDIRLALDKTTLRKAQVPHVYFVGLLDEWAKQPANGHARARAAPAANGHNGNGHAHVHGPEWNGVENGHIVDGAAYHAYHERLAEVRVVKSGGG